MTANIDNLELAIDHLQELLFEARCTLLGFAPVVIVGAYLILFGMAWSKQGIFVILIGPI